MSSGPKDQQRAALAQDELLARYSQARALDDARPGPHLRAAVLAHARSVAAAQLAPRTEASNSPSWRMQALGSLAVIGLVGMLYLQFDRGSQEEREVALGAGSRPAEAPAPAAAQAPALAPAPTPPPTRSTTRPPAQAQESTPDTRLAKAAEIAAAPRSAQDVAKPLADSPKANAAQHQEADAAPSPAPNLALAQVPAPVPAALPAPAPVQAALPVVPAPRAAPALANLAAAGASSSAALASRRDAGEAAPQGAALRVAAQLGDIARLDALLAQGAPLEAADAAGRTPLLLAVMQGRREAVARLLAAGANAQAQDREGVTALRYAQSRAFAEIEALLRQHGAR